MSMIYFYMFLDVDLSEKAWENGAWLLSCLSLFDPFWSLGFCLDPCSRYWYLVAAQRIWDVQMGESMDVALSHIQVHAHSVVSPSSHSCFLSLSLSVSLSASLSLTLFFSDIGPIGLSKRFNMYLYSILKSVKHGKTMCIHDKLYFEQNCLSCHTKLL